MTPNDLSVSLLTRCLILASATSDVARAPSPSNSVAVEEPHPAQEQQQDRPRRVDATAASLSSVAWGRPGIADLGGEEKRRFWPAMTLNRADVVGTPDCRVLARFRHIPPIGDAFRIIIASCFLP